jgi:hypothetical protein
MKHVMRLARWSAAVAALGLVMPRRSLAYIDPGTGSYMLQMLIALAVGAAFALKLFWKRILGFFRRGASKSRPADGERLPAETEQKKEDAV